MPATSWRLTVLVHGETDRVDAPRRHPLDDAEIRRPGEDAGVGNAGVFASHHRDAFEQDRLPGLPVKDLVVYLGLHNRSFTPLA